MKMSKEEREEFRKILKDCQDINGDNAFDILVNFICNNLEEEEKYKMENIQSKMKELFGNSCYAYCISYLSGKSDIKDLTKDVLEGWYRGYIEDDGFVSKPHLFYNYCFRKELAKDVVKKPYDPEPLPFSQIVCFEYKGGTHFVVMRDGKVTFDPSGDSNSVKYGKPVSIREFVCD